MNRKIEFNYSSPSFYEKYFMQYRLSKELEYKFQYSNFPKGGVYYFKYSPSDSLLIESPAVFVKKNTKRIFLKELEERKRKKIKEIEYNSYIEEFFYKEERAVKENSDSSFLNRESYDMQSEMEEKCLDTSNKHMSKEESFSQLSEVNRAVVINSEYNTIDREKKSLEMVIKDDYGLHPPTRIISADANRIEPLFKPLESLDIEGDSYKLDREKEFVSVENAYKNLSRQTSQMHNNQIETLVFRDDSTINQEKTNAKISRVGYYELFEQDEKKVHRPYKEISIEHKKVEIVPKERYLNESHSRDDYFPLKNTSRFTFKDEQYINLNIDMRYIKDLGEIETLQRDYGLVDIECILSRLKSGYLRNIKTEQGTHVKTESRIGFVEEDNAYLNKQLNKISLMDTRIKLNKTKEIDLVIEDNKTKDFIGQWRALAEEDFGEKAVTTSKLAFPYEDSFRSMGNTSKEMQYLNTKNFEKMYKTFDHMSFNKESFSHIKKTYSLVYVDKEKANGEKRHKSIAHNDSESEFADSFRPIPYKKVVVEEEVVLDKTKGKINYVGENLQIFKSHVKTHIKDKQYISLKKGLKSIDEYEFESFVNSRDSIVEVEEVVEVKGYNKKFRMEIDSIVKKQEKQIEYEFHEDIPTHKINQRRSLKEEKQEVGLSLYGRDWLIPHSGKVDYKILPNKDSEYPSTINLLNQNIFEGYYQYKYQYELFNYHERDKEDKTLEVVIYDNNFNKRGSTIVESVGFSQYKNENGIQINIQSMNISNSQLGIKIDIKISLEDIGYITVRQPSKQEGKDFLFAVAQKYMQESHPIPVGKDLGIKEIPVSIDIMVDFINTLIMVWSKFYRPFTGYTGEQAIYSFINLIYEWLQLDSNLEHEAIEDYFRCFRWLRWECEKIYNQARFDLDLTGNYWLEKVFMEMVDYMEMHHFDRMPEWEDVGNINKLKKIVGEQDFKIDLVVDKIKGKRKYTL